MCFDPASRFATEEKSIHRHPKASSGMYNLLEAVQAHLRMMHLEEQEEKAYAARNEQRKANRDRRFSVRAAYKRYRHNLAAKDAAAHSTRV